MTSFTPDIIDLIANITPGSRIDHIRTERPETKSNAQRSFLALFEPADIGDVPLHERFAVAAFVSLLHSSHRIADFYAARLAGASPSPSLTAAINAEGVKGRTHGPYGAYPDGPLTIENADGPVFQTSEFNSVVLGRKLSAALEHAHLLVFRPRDASPAALQRLLDAGWSTTGIVTLSQIVAFLSFQIRVVAGLTVLAASSVETEIRAKEGAQS